MTDLIKRNAQLVVSIAENQLGTRVGFDRQGVKWLDGYIQRQYEHGDVANFSGLINTLGSFFGECLISTYGADWTHTEYGWSVAFDQGNAAFPFAKVAKQLERNTYPVQGYANDKFLSSIMMRTRSKSTFAAIILFFSVFIALGQVPTRDEKLAKANALHNEANGLFNQRTAESNRAALEKWRNRLRMSFAPDPSGRDNSNQI